MTNDDLQQIIREEEVLVIHFSTDMCRPGTVFPDHIRNAINISPNAKLCCSALSKNPGITPAGEVGIIFSISDISQLISVCSTDAVFNGSHSLGQSPTYQTVSDSLNAMHGRHNEWLVKGAPIKGIFVTFPTGSHARRKFPPPSVPYGGTDPIFASSWFSILEIRQAFPDQDIYTLDNGKLVLL